MANATITDLLSRVRPELPSCPTAAMVQAMVDTMRDFFQMTRAWTYEVEQQTVVKSVAEYDIELPSTSVQPIAVEYMTLGSLQVKYRTSAWLDSYIPNWRTRAADDFSCFTQLAPRTFIFPGIPTINGTAGDLYYRVSIKPTEDATTVDQDQADEWLECWADGAKSRLMLQDGKPWSKPKRGADLEKAYRLARSRARIRVDRSYGNPDPIANMQRLTP